MKKTQEEIVLKQLLTKGYVSRNWCLKRYIRRLGAIICRLKNSGWKFKAQYVKGDYIYFTI
jgi:hypothetical protein